MVWLTNGRKKYEYNTTYSLRGIGILGGQSNHLCQQSNDRFLGRNRWAKTYGWRSPGVDLDPGCHYQIGDGQVISIFRNKSTESLTAKMSRNTDLFSALRLNLCLDSCNHKIMQKFD